MGAHFGDSVVSVGRYRCGGHGDPSSLSKVSIINHFIKKS